MVMGAVRMVRKKRRKKGKEGNPHEKLAFHFLD